MSQQTEIAQFPLDPKFEEGEPVNFTVDGSEKRYNGKIRGVAWRHVLTGYIVEFDIVDMDIPVREGGIIVGYVFSKEYPYSSVVLQHNFIERGYTDEV